MEPTAVHRKHQDEAGVDKEQQNSKKARRSGSQSVHPCDGEPEKQMLSKHEEHSYRSEQIQVGREAFSHDRQSLSLQENVAEDCFIAINPVRGHRSCRR